MGRSNNKKKDNETKEQRKARIEATKAAQNQCMKILPFVSVLILVITVAFAIWANGVEPKPYAPSKAANKTTQVVSAKKVVSQKR